MGAAEAFVYEALRTPKPLALARSVTLAAGLPDTVAGVQLDASLRQRAQTTPSTPAQESA